MWCIFLAVRVRLSEIAVPPGTALLEKLAALAPGLTDTLIRRVSDSFARKTARRAATR